VNTYGPLDGPFVILARPGLHRLRVTLSGYEDATWEIDARTGTSHSHPFELSRTTVERPASVTGEDAGVRPHSDRRFYRTHRHRAFCRRRRCDGNACPLKKELF
jgi:hypothetical protein